MIQTCSESTQLKVNSAAWHRAMGSHRNNTPGSLWKRHTMLNTLNDQKVSQNEATTNGLPAHRLRRKWRMPGSDVTQPPVNKRMRVLYLHTLLGKTRKDYNYTLLHLPYLNYILGQGQNDLVPSVTFPSWIRIFWFSGSSLGWLEVLSCPTCPLICRHMLLSCTFSNTFAGTKILWVILRVITAPNRMPPSLG